MAVVYAAENALVPGARYVGVAKNGMAARRARHHWDANRGSRLYFHRALIKYGFDAFSWAVLSEHDDYAEALVAERAAIALGAEYNLTAGGGGVLGFKFSDESRAKMSAARKGKAGPWSAGMPQEMKDRLAHCRRTEVRIRTDAERRSLRANIAIAVAARRRAVRCLTDGAVYPSMTAAAAAYGVAHGSIERWVRGLPNRRGLKFEAVA